MKSPLKNLTLLYVEDEKMIRQNAVEYLSRICNNVLEAKNGLDMISINLILLLPILKCQK